MADGHRVFISHAAHEDEEPRTLVFVNALESALQAKGAFDVFLDRQRLKPGQDWRDEIYLYLGLCHSAVVVLSPRSARDGSIWVPRESTILLWRLALDPAFAVIPVYVSGFDPGALSGGVFSDSGLERLHAVVADDPQSAIEGLVDVLEKRREVQKSTPVDEVADQISAVLTDIKPKGVERALKKVGGDLVAWTGAEDRYRQLAMALLGMKLLDAIDFIQEELLPFARNEDSVGGELFELISPMWVDLQAAQWIPRCSLPRENKRIMVLNASRRFVADMYMQRATCRRRRDGWPVVEAPVNVRSDEQAVSEVEWRLLETLLDARPSTSGAARPPQPSPAQRERLRSVLELRNQRMRPVICLVRSRPGLRSLLRKLRDEFPQISLLVLSGEQFPELDELSELTPKLLEPPLLDKQEHDILNIYCYAVGCLGIKPYAEECSQ